MAAQAARKRHRAAPIWGKAEAGIRFRAITSKYLPFGTDGGKVIRLTQVGKRRREARCRTGSHPTLRKTGEGWGTRLRLHSVLVYYALGGIFHGGKRPILFRIVQIQLMYAVLKLFH